MFGCDELLTYDFTDLDLLRGLADLLIRYSSGYFRIKESLGSGVKAYSNALGYRTSTDLFSRPADVRFLFYSVVDWAVTNARASLNRFETSLSIVS